MVWGQRLAYLIFELIVISVSSEVGLKVEVFHEGHHEHGQPKVIVHRDADEAQQVGVL